MKKGYKMTRTVHLSFEMVAWAENEEAAYDKAGAMFDREIEYAKEKNFGFARPVNVNCSVDHVVSYGCERKKQ